jgi:hypothetical protein
MFVQRLVQTALVYFGAWAVALSATPSATQPVMLLPQVEIGTKTVLLSDLLPQTALAPLREVGATVSLGSAPMPGRSRIVTRAELQATLASNPQLEADLWIPIEITIRRTCHLVSPKQVSAALGFALGTGSAEGPVDFSLLTPVCFSGDDPGLEVSSVEFDPLQRLTRFRLWTSKEPQNLPFYVTLPGRLNEAVVHTAGRPAFHTMASSPDPNHLGNRTGNGTLVKAGVATRLVIQGPDCRITTVVVPLQSGALGQQIRARDPLTLRVFSAHVAGPALLTAAL